jgi:hypothetical protein
MPCWRSIAWCWLVLGALAPRQVSGAEPRLDLILPRGGRQGTRQTLEFHGLRLADAVDVIFADEGFKLESLRAVSDTLVRATLAIDPQCPAGQHGLRLLTRSGVSELRSFHVGTLPRQDESEPNDQHSEANRVRFPVTFAGVLRENDIDCVEFSAEAGSLISAEVEALRLGTVAFNGIEPLIDPVLELIGPDNQTLAEVDDSPLTGHDPCLSFVAPRTGTYWITLRDAVNGGGEHHCYLLHLGDFRRPTVAFPAGGQAGARRDVQFLGMVGLAPPREPIDIPRSATGALRLLANERIAPPTPVPFRVSPFPDCLEVEPNDDWKTATVEPVDLPQAFNGIIDHPGDVDCFRIRTRETMGVNVRVYCGNVGSPLDPVVTIYNDLGQLVTQADDSEFMDDMAGRSTDSFCRFYPDAGRIYCLCLAGHLGQGGADHVYRVEITPVEEWVVPYLREQVEYSQERMAVAVPRGNRFLTMVGIRRGNFAGAVHLEASELPLGVRCDAQLAAESVDAIPLVFEAAPDAPLGWRGAQIEARADRFGGPRGALRQPIELSVGMPAYTPYAVYHEQRLAVAVVEKAPIEVRLSVPPTPLVRNGVLPLQVRVKRAPDCNGEIEVQLPFKPPGVGAQPSILIPAGQDSGIYELTAEADAELGVWKLGVLAMVRVKGGQLWVASALEELEVAEPYLDAKIQMAAVEQGGQTTVACPVQWLRSMARPGQAELLGLPHGVTARPVAVHDQDQLISFVVHAAADAPVGKFTTLVCRFSADDGQGPIIHHLDGEGILRIDAERMATGGSSFDNENVRPMSLLEQLRKEYAEWLQQQR